MYELDEGEVSGEVSDGWKQKLSTAIVMVTHSIRH